MHEDFRAASAFDVWKVDVSPLIRDDGDSLPPAVSRAEESASAVSESAFQQARKIL